MVSLGRLVPQVEDLLSLQPEELGGVILRVLSSANRDESYILNRSNFISTNNEHIAAYPQDKWDQVRFLLAEGWAWLESEGLIAPEPSQTGNWVFITRRGRAAASENQFSSYVSSTTLRKELLHPLIVEACWPAYLRGDYDSAIFTAFKQVEIGVRKLSGLPVEVIGTDLMRKAFSPSGGALCPNELPKAEQEALASLFAGSIGWFKNPQSHREVRVSQITSAAQALMIASYLLSEAELRQLLS